MKKLILISLIFLGLTSCSKKDDIVQPTSIQKEWYEGHYTGPYGGDILYVNYSKNHMTSSFDTLIDLQFYSDTLIINCPDSVVFKSNNDYLGQQMNIVMYDNLNLKVKLVNDSILADIQLTRID